MLTHKGYFYGPEGSRATFISQKIFEKGDFFPSADKTFESRRRGDHERPEWHLTNDDTDQQHLDDKSLNRFEVSTNNVLLYSVSCVQSSAHAPDSQPPSN